MRNTLRTALVLAALSCALLATATPAFALGPGAIRTPASFNASSVPAGDDTNLLVVGLPFTMNWNGTVYNQIYINMNGTCSFNGWYANNNAQNWTPSIPLTQTPYAVMAPFWSDVDTRAGMKVTYSSTTTGSIPTVNGHKAFLVNWQGVRPYDATTYTTATAPVDYFQLVIIDRSDVASGAFDFEFNYDQITWDTGSASYNGTTYYRARAGWAASSTAGYELPGSGARYTGTYSAIGGPLDDVAASSTALIWNSQCSENQLGRYRWQVRNGQPPNLPPDINVINRTLEANTQGGYASYNATASGDASATDSDGSLASFTSSPSLPATLPLGTNYISWTATDNRGAVTTATQTVIVTDTTPPTLPTLGSTTATGTWTNNASVTVTWPASSDIATGVAGYSYLWSQNATGLPDVAVDTTASTNTSTLPDGTWYFNIRAADRTGNWTVTRSLGPFRIDTAPPTTVDNIPSTWTTGSITVTLTATDPSGPVSSTVYTLNGGATTTYTAPFVISAQGTTTVQYLSRDAAGNVESTHTAFALIDSTAPSQPATVHANAIATSSVEITWTASSDAVSGVSYYRIYQNGSLIATSPAVTTTFTATGLTSGSSYTYSVVAVDLAGNASSATAAVSVSPPLAALWLTITTPNPSQGVDMGTVYPNVASTLPSAAIVSVGGVGAINYTLTTASTDFTNVTTSSTPPTMPASAMSYSTRGWHVIGPTAFSNSPAAVWTDTGTRYVWQQTYIFDFSITVGYQYSPGDYKSGLTFTATQN